MARGVGTAGFAYTHVKRSEHPMSEWKDAQAHPTAALATCMRNIHRFEYEEPRQASAKASE